MNSNDIRTMINKSFEHEEHTGDAARLLAQYSINRGLNLTAEQQADCLAFIKGYIQETPDLMDAAFLSAKQTNMLATMQPVLDAAFHYWAEEQDFIPDSLGLFGLADDAYLTRMFMESISGLHAQQVGTPLLSIDLGPANRVMRQLIGEPVASQLDVHIGQTIAGQLMQTSLQQLMNFGGPFSLGMPDYGNYISQYEIDQSVNVRLGAMGVV
jgi:uncharacterized membrane protein YkvA (DUF1232 family)